MSDHMMSAMAFIGFFAGCLLLAKITTPKKYRNIKVSDMPIKPNPLICSVEYMETALEMQQAENARLVTAIRETIEENLHLSDGENCTLIKLKRAIEYT